MTRRQRRVWQRRVSYLLPSLLLIPLVFLPAKDWPSTAGTTAKGIVIEDGAGNQVTNFAAGSYASGIVLGRTAAGTGPVSALTQIVLNGSTGGATLPTLPVGTSVYAANVDGTTARFHSDVWAGAPIFSGRRANNTIASPTTLVSGNIFASLQGFGYDGTSYSTLVGGSINIVATETWTNAAHGTEVGIATSPNGSTSAAFTAKFGQDGSFTAGAIAGTGVNRVYAGSYAIGASLADSGTAPTIASGGCTTGSAQSISANNGTAAFSITLGGATCGSTITLTLPASSTKWHCTADDITTPASNEVHQTAAASSTSVVLTNYVRTTGVAGNFTAADVLLVSCRGF